MGQELERDGGPDYLSLHFKEVYDQNMLRVIMTQVEGATGCLQEAGGPLSTRAALPLSREGKQGVRVTRQVCDPAAYPQQPCVFVPASPRPCARGEQRLRHGGAS